jgi:tetratricopeptide (TPR) repeat protein
LVARDGRLSDDLTAIPTPPVNGNDAPAPSSVPAALAIQVESVIHDPYAAPTTTSPLLAKLDEHRLVILGAAVALAVLLITGITIHSLRKRTLTATTYEVVSSLAEQEYRNGNYDTAIVLLQDVARTAKSSPAPNVLLGNAYFKKGDLEQAENQFRTALQKEPGAPRALMNLGLTLYRQQRLDEARAYYEKALALYGKTHPRLRERAQVSLTLIADASMQSPSREP